MHAMLEKFLKKTFQKSPADNRLVVFDFSSSSLNVLYLEAEVAAAKQAGGGLRIKNFFQTPETAASLPDRQRAAGNYVSSLSLKNRPRAVVHWSEGTVFRQLTLPPLPSEDIKQALCWDLKKKYFVNPEDHLVSFQEVMSLVSGESQEKLYSVFYCPRKPVDAVLQWVEDLGFETQGVIAWQSALAKFTGMSLHDPDHDILLCDLSPAAVRILVLRQAKVMLARQVPLEAGKLPLAEEAMEKIAQEIEKSAEFYETQKYSRAISRLFFTGAASESVSLKEFMGRRLELKLGSLSAAAYSSPSLEEEKKKFISEQTSIFIPSLGAALVRDDELNLLPDEIQRRNKQVQNENVLQAIFIAVAGFLGLLLFITWVRVGAVSARLAATEKEWTKVQSDKKLLDSISFREQVRHSAKKGDVSHGAFLKHLGRIVPAQVELKQISFSREAGTLLLTGEVHDVGKENVRIASQFADILQQSPFFKNVALTNTTLETQGQNFRFEIRCVVKGIG